METQQVVEQLQSQVDLLRTRNEELEKRLLLRLDTINRQGATNVVADGLSGEERATQCDLISNASADPKVT